MATTADRLAADIREIDGNHSLGAGALAEALIGKGWRAPIKLASYREVGPATEVKVGQLVRSKWSSSGAVWRVTEVGAEKSLYGERSRLLSIVSLSSNRQDTRWASEVVIVTPNQ